MDVRTNPAWNGAIVALLAVVTNEAESAAAPTSDANLRLYNVCDGTKSREPNSAEKITH
jgi:hypothetical protein